MKQALITGSSGFVGRHLVPKLKAEGYHLVGCDIARDKAQDASLLKHNPSGPAWDVIVHLAANIVDVDARARGGVRMYDDMALDLSVLRYVESNPPKEAFICMSSCAVDNPNDPYGWVKITLERLAMELHRKGIPVVILRPFSGYGEDQSEAYPFRAILERSLRHEDPLLVWGGDQIRDFIHIDDLTRAMVHAIHHFPRGIPIDVGTGIGTPLASLAVSIADEVGYRPAIYCDPGKAQSSPRRVADTTLARASGFETTISLREGIRRAVSMKQERCAS